MNMRRCHNAEGFEDLQIKWVVSLETTHFAFFYESAMYWLLLLLCFAIIQNGNKECGTRKCPMKGENWMEIYNYCVGDERYAI